LSELSQLVVYATWSAAAAAGGCGGGRGASGGASGGAFFWGHHRFAGLSQIGQK